MTATSLPRPPAPVRRPGGAAAAVRADRSAGGRWAGDRWAVAVLALAWALVVVPRSVQSLTAPKFRTTVGVEAAPYGALAQLTERGLSGVLALVCVAAVLAGARRLPLRTLPLLTALAAPWLVTVVRDVYAGTAPVTTAALYPLVAAALWAAYPRVRVLAVVGHLTGATAVLAVAMGALVPMAGLYRSAAGDLISPDKQLLPVGLLVGPFTDSNNLGQVLVLGAPALLAVRRRGAALAWLAVVLVALVWSSSRSSLVAAGAAGAAVAVVALARTPGVRALLAGLAGAGALATVVLVPLLTVASATTGAARASTADLAFTNRGYVWRLSLETFSQRPLTGWGSNWYSEVGGTANPLGGFTYHGHNQLVQQLVTTGLLGTAALAVLALAALGAARTWAAGGGRAGLAPLGHVVALCLSCTFEVSFGVVDRSFLLPVAMAPLAVALLARRERP